MTLSKVITKESVIAAAKKLKVALNSRSWERYDHKLKKIECMCAITAYIKANISTKFDPGSAEPGEDEYSCKQAATLLNVSYEEVHGFIVGFDGDNLRDWYPKSHDKSIGWAYGKQLRKELLDAGVEFKNGY